MSEITIIDIINQELTDRLERYAQLIRGEKISRELANSAYIALQTALWMAGGCQQPAMPSSEREALDELRNMIRVLQRDATVETMHQVGREVEIIQAFIEEKKPKIQPPLQFTID